MKINPKMSWLEAHEIMVATVAPRPIASVSTIGCDGIYNVAPFSLVTPISMQPIIIGFSIGRRKGEKKDTLNNIEFSKDFVINAVSENIFKKMLQSAESYPSEVDEFKEVGLTPVKAEYIKAPMVGESPISLECRLKRILEFGIPPRNNNFIIGEVVQIHIKDEFYVDNEILADKLKLIGRLGGDRYCRTIDVIEMKRPNTLV